MAENKVLQDGLKINVVWTIDKFKGNLTEEQRKVYLAGKLQPYKKVVFRGNLGLNEGINELLKLITGVGSPTAWNAANARIGVGDSDVAEAATQTGLQAVSSRTAWTPSTAKVLGDFVRPTSITDANVFVYECTVAGTTGTTEPTWPVVEGQTVVDGTVTWTCRRRKTFKGMMADYPKVENQTAYFRSEYLNDEAVYTWKEFTIVNAADDTGKNLDRKVSDQGTKPNTETWIVTGQITPY